jgi:hypothetical protein
MDEYYEDMDGDEIEFSEEDFISEEEMEEEVGGDEGEAYAMPFSSVYINRLPDKLNPVKLFKAKELTLYNPNDRIQPYSKIEPSLLTFDMLKNNLIVNAIKFDQNSSLEQFASYAKILNNGITPIVSNYTDYERSKETIEQPQNTNSFGSKNSFKPKPQGVAQGRKNKSKGKGKKK